MNSKVINKIAFETAKQQARSLRGIAVDYLSDEQRLSLLYEFTDGWCRVCGIITDTPCTCERDE